MPAPQLASLVESYPTIDTLGRPELIAFFRAFMDSAPLGLAFLDRDLRFVHINRALADMNGLPPEDHLGRTLDEVLPQLAGRLSPLLRLVLDSGSPVVNMELSGETPASPGEARHWLVNYFPVVEEGQTVGAGAVVMETTARKRHEITSGESVRQMQALVRRSPEAMALHAPDGTLLYTPPTPKRILGYAVEDFVGPHALQRIHPDDFDRVYRHLLELRASPGKEMTLQYRSKHMNGTWCWVEAYGINAVQDPENGAVLTYYRDITDRKALEDDLIHQAFHDPLTRLPNRVRFVQGLEDALLRESVPPGFIAVMFIDLDGFKTINDTLGHSVGDDLLVEVSRRFLKSLRAEDVLARMGGDEFTILLKDAHRVDEAVEVAKRILKELAHPFHLSQREVFVSASIGIALALPGAARSGDLLRKADIALYEAKKKGKACYEIFDLSMNERAWKRMELEADLRRALEKDELEVYYQPVIDLHSGKVVELEALVRWRHPERGLLPPLEFLPLAEETGQVLDIDLWVLKTAARGVRSLREEFQEFRELSLTVNLSALQFRHGRLTEGIRRTLREAGLPPGGLKIEITENILREDPESVLSQLTALKELGIRLSIDDFGIGYSATKYLQQYPLDILKIDRTIIRELRPENADNKTEEPDIVQKIFSYGREHGMSITGEGIESLEQLNQLRKLGCKLGQGYLFAKPQPMEELRHLFEMSSSGQVIPLGSGGKIVHDNGNGSQV